MHCWVCCSSPVFLAPLLSHGTITSSFMLKKRKYDAVDQHCFCSCNKMKWDPMYSAVTWASQTYWPSLWLLMCKTLCLPAVKDISHFGSENKERKKDRRTDFYMCDAPTSFFKLIVSILPQPQASSNSCSHRIKKALLFAHAVLVSK